MKRAQRSAQGAVHKQVLDFFKPVSQDLGKLKAPEKVFFGSLVSVRWPRLAVSGAEIGASRLKRVLPEGAHGFQLAICCSFSHGVLL